MSTFQGWLKRSGFGGAVSEQLLSGGDICRTQKIVTHNGTVLCVKQLDTARAPENFFSTEAAGLNALKTAQAKCNDLILIPDVISQSDNYLAMAYISPGNPEEGSWQRLAEGLAKMHADPAPYFGFTTDNYCGLTPQPNKPCENGYQFFAEQRLLYQGRLAFDKKRFSAAELQRLESLAKKLSELIPEQPPGLIHGDLWSGNVLFDTHGKPTIIDPACYYGWAEAELAMTALFGGFPESFYRHYQMINPLEKDWRERFPLYNLYHLLNHVNLFGGHYQQQAAKVLNKYC